MEEEIIAQEEEVVTPEEQPLVSQERVNIDPAERIRTNKLDYRIPKKLQYLLDGFKSAIHTKKQSAVVIIDGRSGMGKCQTKGSKVLMSDGSWKNIEDIRNGDEIISPQEDGSFIYSKVSGTTSWFADEVYNIMSRSTGKKLYSCSGNHLVPVNKSHNKRYGNSRKYFRTIENIEVSKLYSSHGNNKSSKFSLFSSTPVEYKVEDCLIEPYSLGVFLGDGHFSGTQLGITSADIDILNEVSKSYPIISIFEDKRGNKSKQYRFSVIKEFGILLNQYGLKNTNSSTKFIPEGALYSSIEYRRKLLAGLIDTDGWVEKFNCLRYSTKSKILADNINDLVFSLGGVSSIKKVKKKSQNGTVGEYYTLCISFKNPLEIPLITKKKDRLKITKQEPRNITVNIIKSNPQMVYGFELNGKSKWYITDNWMVTHNTTLSFQIGRYMSKDFSLDSVHFTPETFIEALSHTTKGDVLVFDEAMLLSSRSALSAVNRMIIIAMSMIRSKNLCIIFNVNSIFDLDRNLALSRADLLLHCYGDSLTDKGKFLAFFKGGDGRDRIKDLYIQGKKYYSYGSPKSNFNTVFGSKFVLDEDEYERRKQIGVNNFLKGSKSAKITKDKIQRDNYIRYLYENHKLTQEQIANIGDVSDKTVWETLSGSRKIEKEGGLP